MHVHLITALDTHPAAAYCSLARQRCACKSLNKLQAVLTSGGSGRVVRQTLVCCGIKPAQEAASKFQWDFSKPVSSIRSNQQVKPLPLNQIKRPLRHTRSYDQEKVAALMASIEEIGLQEPIDVLEVDGQHYGFSGCHRYEAHEKLGKETILCRIRKANESTLKLHLM